MSPGEMERRILDTSRKVSSLEAQLVLIKEELDKRREDPLHMLPQEGRDTIARHIYAMVDSILHGMGFKVVKGRIKK